MTRYIHDTIIWFVTSSRKLYEAYLDRSRDMRCLPYQYASFLEFARHFKKPEGNTVYATRDSNRGKYAKKEWTAIGIRFGWELLDIYIGQYVAVKRQMWHAGERDMINITSSKHIIIKWCPVPFICYSIWSWSDNQFDRNMILISNTV